MVQNLFRINCNESQYSETFDIPKLITCMKNVNLYNFFGKKVIWCKKSFLLCCCPLFETTNWSSQRVVCTITVWSRLSLFSKTFKTIYLKDDPAASHVLILDEVGRVVALFLRLFEEELWEAVKGDVVAVEESRLKLIKNYLWVKCDHPLSEHLGLT